ncbi:hypothetical protein BDW74DRAFT_168494 [Aspergillus multicolor]|uniref:uncharacterized protein n=1 Tax=Aspergillus multicolor TaxID=41759 RepID=UPI003CCE1D60
MDNVLVSASGQGSGRGIRKTFVSEGALVLGLDLQAVDGPVDGFPEDKAYRITAPVDEELTIAKFGKAPSIVVHNAGWSYPSKSGLDMTVEEFDRLSNVNVRSVYLAPKATQTWYNATKAGVSSATKSMALDLMGISDGPVPAEIIKAKSKAIPIGRLVEPSDVANVALSLAEPASSIISGVEILVDGARCV